MKLLVLLVVCLAACGSKSSSSTGPEAAKVVLPDVPFDQLDQDQRVEFMKQKVVPAMEPIFKKHDAQEFAEFGCQTCHGKQAAQGHFDMPNPDLPKLNFNDMSQFKPEDIEWMKTEVKPAMAKLLEEEEFTPENPKGFGCQDCHVTE
jgi:mono/diheme cytochrome c family protein